MEGQKLVDQIFSLDTNIVQDDGNDPIIVSIIINTFLVERILIDDESVDVESIQEMGLDESQLRPAESTYGFTNQPIKEKWVICYQSQSIMVNTL